MGVHGRVSTNFKPGGWISSLLLVLAMCELSMAVENSANVAQKNNGAQTHEVASDSGRVAFANPTGRKKRGILDNYYAAVPTQGPHPNPEFYIKTVVNKGEYGPPAENLTRTQIAFSRLNNDPHAFVEQFYQPMIQRYPELRDSFVINLDGRPVTCADVCTPGVVFGFIGLCTRDYCVCNPDLDSSAGINYHGSISGYEPQRHAREQRCPEGQVYDGVTLTCKDPRNTIMCDDHHIPLRPRNPHLGQNSGADVIQTVGHPGTVQKIHGLHPLTAQYPQTSGQTVGLQPVAQTVGVSSIPAPIISYNHKAAFETVEKYAKYPAVLLNNGQLEANQSPVHQVYRQQK